MKSSFLAGNSYINLPKELGHPKKGLFNIQNCDDSQCFKWYLIRYLHPADHHPITIRKFDKILEQESDFKDIKLLVKIRYIHKIEKKNKNLPA